METKKDSPLKEPVLVLPMLVSDEGGKGMWQTCSGTPCNRSLISVKLPCPCPL